MLKPILVLTVALASASCATPRSLNAVLHTASSPRLEVRRARAYATAEGIVVAGLVRRPVLSRGRIPGHLHVEARFVDGRPPVTASAHTGSVSAHGARLAHFRVRLPVNDDGIAAITISHVSHAHAGERPGGISPKRPGHA